MQDTQKMLPSGAWFKSTLSNVKRLVKYLLSMLWIVDLCRKLVTTGGIIAESAFLMATLYVIINATGHVLLAWILPDGVITTLNQISVISFSILPELIMVSAIVITFDHWQMFRRTRSVAAFLWTLCYAIPTTIFLCMTVQLLISFMGLESTTGAAPTATGSALIIRCLAGLSYGILQMLWAKMGEAETYTKRYDKFVATLAELHSTFENSTKHFESVIAQNAIDYEMTLSKSATEHESAITKSAMHIAELEEIALANSAKIAHLESALLEANITIANRKVLRNSATDDTEKVLYSTRTRSKKAPSNVLQMESGAKKTRIKKHMKSAIVNGEKMNMRQIASGAKVSYGMVRTYYDELLKEITDELTPVSQEG